MTMKLVNTEQLEVNLTSIADKIRIKAGSKDALAFPDGFVNAVNGIESNINKEFAEIEYLLSDGYKNYSHYF